MNEEKTLLSVFQNCSESNHGIYLINNADSIEFLSYKNLYNHALKVLNVLQLKGLKYQDELIIYLNDIKSFIIYFWACILGGIIPVPVSFIQNNAISHKLFRIWKILNNPYLLTGKKYSDSINASAKEFSLTGQIDLFKFNHQQIFIDDADRDGLQSADQGKIHQSTPDDIVFIQFSSGSTSEPKGIIIKNYNIISNLEAIRKCSGLTENDSSLNWLPLTHDLGLIGFHIAPIFLKINQYQLPVQVFLRNPLLWMDYASYYQISILSSPNFGYNYFLTHIKDSKNYNWDLSCIRLIFNGAEPISIDTIHSFYDKLNPYGLKRTTIYPVYGMAEATLAVSFPAPHQELSFVNLKRNSVQMNTQVQPVTEMTHNTDAYIKFVSVGKPVSDCSIRIVDENENVLSENSIGQIQIRGRNVTAGYYNNPEITKKTIDKQGWLSTGDLGFCCGNALYVVGRIKDVIFIKGQNFFAYDIDSIIEQRFNFKYGKIATCCGFDYEIHEDYILVYVQYKKKLDEEFYSIAGDIKQYLLKSTGINIKHVLPVDSIPRTTSGKIQRYKLVSMYENNQFKDIIRQMEKKFSTVNPNANTADTIEEIENNLMDICKNVMGLEIIDKHESLNEYNIDSLLLTRLYVHIDELYPGKIKLTDFYSRTTIPQIAHLIKGDSNKELKTVSMPPDFFIAQAGNNPESIIELKLQGAPYERFNQILNEYHLNAYITLLGCLVFFLNKISNSDIIPLYVLNEKKQIIQLLIELNQETELFDLFSRINKEIQDNENIICQLDHLDDIKTINEKEMITVFACNSLYFNQGKNFSHYFDFIFEIDITLHNCYAFSIGYNHNRVKRERCELFATGYINLINFFIDKIMNTILLCK